jgi:hypothetical protein
MRHAALRKQLNRKIFISTPRPGFACPMALLRATLAESE